MKGADSQSAKLGPYESAIHDLLLVAPKVTSYNLKPPFDETIDPYTARAASTVIERSGALLSAIVQANGVIEDMRAVLAMMGKYPWDEKKVSRSKHLDLNWFLFQNLCYKFKEKLKLAFNCQKQVCRPLALSEPSWIKFELKNVERAMGSHIQDRGNTVHSWNTKHSGIDFLSTVELFMSFRESGEEMDLPEGFFDILGHYRDTRFWVKLATRKALREAEECIERVLTKHEPEPKHILRKTEELVDLVLKKEILIRPL